MAEGTAGERGLRLDAVRNQERIVVAAAAAFAELGADVTLEEVARRAGVGVATVYRRFRNRDQLVRAVVAHVLTAEIEPVAEIETDDPWRDLAATLEASVAAVAAHSEVVALAHAAGAIDVDVVDRYLHRLDRVLTRARAAGLVRPELEPRDLAVAVMMVLATVRKVDRDGCGDEGGGWRRYLALLLDGMRPAPTRCPVRRSPEPQAVRRHHHRHRVADRPDERVVRTPVVEREQHDVAVPVAHELAHVEPVVHEQLGGGDVERLAAGLGRHRPDPAGGHRGGAGGRELRAQAGEQQHRAPVDDLPLHHLELAEPRAGRRARRPRRPAPQVGRPGGADHAAVVVRPGAARAVTSMCQPSPPDRVDPRVAPVLAGPALASTSYQRGPRAGRVGGSRSR